MSRLEQTARVAIKALAAAVDPLLDPLVGPRILIYHQVGVNLGREMEVSLEVFASQLDWIQAHGEIVDLESAVERRAEPDADRLAVLTFDDGFEDMYLNAFPLLKERGLPFTLYLTTRPIETGEPLDPRFPAAKPLTWDQVNEMIGTGLVTVGAHTHTHPDLRALSEAVIASEMETSDRLIEIHTGIKPRHFTYPFGWWCEAADAEARMRYTTATLGSGQGTAGWSSLYRISRVPVQRSDRGLLFGRKMSTGAITEARLRRVATGYRGP